LVENEKAKEQPDNPWLEHLLKNKIEFAFKFSLGTEAFTKLVSERIARELQVLQIELDQIQSQIQHQERKFARLQARRQGKILLNCEYRKNLGCFGDYQCENCQVNYPVPETNQLKGGAC
jgi:PHP family Zn ribbon phosphoesterase